jgi:CBS domain containing-hemolysin-like protein
MSMVGLGIITIEDIVEELLESEDEHDSDEELIEKEMGDDTYISAGLTSVIKPTNNIPE